MAETTNKAGAFSTASIMLSAFGGINQAVGSYYAAKTQQYESASQALSYDLSADIAVMNAKQSEDDARFAMYKGEKEIGALTMKSGQEAASMRAQMAANGVALDVGSAAEAMATHEIMKQRDVYEINASRVREASSARMQAAAYRGQAIMDRTSANNMRRTSSTISPTLAGYTSLLNSAGQVASQWYNNKRK